MTNRSRTPSTTTKLINLLAALSALYGLVASLFLLLRKPVSEDNKLISLFNAFAHLLMLPALVLVPLSVLLKRPWVALFHLLPAVTFLRDYVRFFQPRPVVLPANTTRQLKVLTYNIHGEAEILDPMVSILRGCGADVISLQELSEEAADCFKSAVSDLYPHMALYPDAQASRGQGVLSRFPITSEEYWRNPQIAKHTLGHLRVELDVGGTTVTLYNAHPIHPGMGNHGFSTRPRGAEIDVVLGKAAGDSGPILIMGDFNMTDQSEDYQRITGRFTDSFGTVGSGMGFTFPDLSDFQSLPTYWPLPVRLFRFLRLDYIFHNGYFHPLHAYVWPTAGGSDHRPVFALLALKDTPTS